MALSTEQLCYINNLLYSDYPSIYSNGPQASYENRSLGDVVNGISRTMAKEGKVSENEYITNPEWGQMVNHIQQDNQLMNLKIVSTYHDCVTGDKGCVLVDQTTNEAIVAFCGTGHGEWKDNFVAGAATNTSSSDATISNQQQRALDYVNSLNLSQYDMVTTTGHSKGGNKAKICALLNDDVDRCVSFDGQGFSDEFMDIHAADVARNQGKIQNHNADGDFVDILLNDVGITQYYRGERGDGNFPKYHSPSSLFANDGTMKPVPGQLPEMKEMDRYLNAMLRSVDPGKKAELLDFAGEVADAFFGSDEASRMDNVRDVLFDPRYTDQMAYVLAYTLEYEHGTGKISNSLSDTFARMGLEDFSMYAEIANVVLQNEWLYGKLKSTLQNSDEIPSWLISALRSALGLAHINIPLTDAEIRQLLGVIGRTGDYMGNIRIDPSSGEDIVISNSAPVLEEVPPIESTLEEINFSNAIIMVGFAELMSNCQELRQAVDYYNSGIEQLSTAAQALSASWEGEGRDAFYQNQMKAFGYYRSLRDLGKAAAEKLSDIHDQYQEAQSRLVQMMQ